MDNPKTYERKVCVFVGALAIPREITEYYLSCYIRNMNKIAFSPRLVHIIDQNYTDRPQI